LSFHPPSTSDAPHATASASPVPSDAAARRSDPGSEFERRVTTAARRLGRYGTRIILAASATWYASDFLLRLSGHALWLPEEWRATVRVVGVAFATAMFEVFLALQRALAPKPAARRPGPSHSAWRAFASWSAVVVLVAVSAWCRSEVIVRWEPSDAWLELHGHIAAAPPSQPAAPPSRLNEPTPRRGPLTPDPLPSFVDFERKLVFVPFEWAWPESRLAEFRALGEVSPNVARMPWMQSSSQAVLTSSSTSSTVATAREPSSDRRC
jgi:hypothetical protein